MPNLPYISNTAVAASTPFGGVTLTINSVSYRALNWAPEKSTREIPRRNADGDEAEFMLRAEPTRQSGLTLQLAYANIALPTMGQNFAQDNANYVITGVGQKKPEGDWWTVDISYRAIALPTD